MPQHRVTENVLIREDVTKTRHGDDFRGGGERGEGVGRRKCGGEGGREQGKGGGGEEEGIASEWGEGEEGKE